MECIRLPDRRSRVISVRRVQNSPDNNTGGLGKPALRSLSTVPASANLNHCAIGAERGLRQAEPDLLVSHFGPGLGVHQVCHCISAKAVGGLSSKTIAGVECGGLGASDAQAGIE